MTERNSDALLIRARDCMAASLRAGSNNPVGRDGRTKFSIEDMVAAHEMVDLLKELNEFLPPEEPKPLHPAVATLREWEARRKGRKPQLSLGTTPHTGAGE